MHHSVSFMLVFSVNKANYSLTCYFIASHLAHARIITYFTIGEHIQPSQEGMFEGADAFDQNISNWNVSSGTNFVSFLLWMIEFC